MTVPRFFHRIHDAIEPLLRSPLSLEEHLSARRIVISTDETAASEPSLLAGFMLLVNLCARIYPRIDVHAPERLAREAEVLIRSINPLCEINGAGSHDLAHTIAWNTDCPESDVHVSISGWNVLVGHCLPSVDSPNILASLAGGAVGASELFRHVFASALAVGPPTVSGCFNILTLDESERPDLPELPSELDFGEVRLVGAGAIGQAFVYTLGRIHAQGKLVVIDPEIVTLSNLQRYVLTTDSDEGRSKVDVVKAALQASALTVNAVNEIWSANHAKNAHRVCVALDTEAGRIALQAGLPKLIYNAWTQPADLGWSRHESFGDEPCLACLYWPQGRRPGRHELIANTIRQHPLRVLGYLTSNVTVDAPLSPSQVPNISEHPLPSESAEWTQRSLLDDIASHLRLEPEQQHEWHGKLLDDLYREGICGGAILNAAGPVPTEVRVPLAHQSALAGIMLATTLVVSASPKLQPFRTVQPEARLDVLQPLPQVHVRPRMKTPGCICSDNDYGERYRQKWLR